MDRASGGAEPSGNPLDWKRLAVAVGLLVLATVLGRQIVQLLLHVWYFLSFPYQLDYGEGIVWQQMRDMVQGTAYGPLQVYPAIVYHYPPVFHLSTAGVAQVFGLDELVAGRLVSLASCFATAALIGWLVARMCPSHLDRPVKLGSGILAAMLFLACIPVMSWALLMRVDMLAVALAMLGLVFSVRAIDRPHMIYAAGAAFVLSLYTKQNSVAAPLAAIAVLFLVAPRAALRGFLFASVVGLAILTAMIIATDGGILRHLVLYNINRFSIVPLLSGLLPMVLLHFAMLAVAAWAALMSWRHVRPMLRSSARHRILTDHSAAPTLMLLLFLLLKTFMLLGMMKSGSAINYMIEWFAVIAVFAGLFLSELIGFVLKRTSALKMPTMPLFLALLGLPIQVTAWPLLHGSSHAVDDLERVRAPIEQRIRASQAPVISDDMTLLLRAGRPVTWEPAIAAELGHSGIYDEAAFARLIEKRCFGFFVTEGNEGSLIFGQRYNPVVAAAIAKAYPVKEEMRGWVLHLPVTAAAGAPGCVGGPMGPAPAAARP